MKIIKKGILPTHTFTCKNCSTVFEAEGAEFERKYVLRDIGSVTAAFFVYNATCPVCGKKVQDIEP